MANIIKIRHSESNKPFQKIKKVKNKIISGRPAKHTKKKKSEVTLTMKRNP